MNPTFEINSTVDPFGTLDGVSFRLFQRRPGNRVVLVDGFNLKEYCTEDSELHSWRPPDFSISAQAAQKLVDQLWDHGYRPSAAKGSAGQLDAVQRHLADMRALVSAKTKVKL